MERGENFAGGISGGPGRLGSGDALRAAISATGYEVGEIRKEPWEKKGLFSW